MKLSIQVPTNGGFIALDDRRLGVYVPMHFVCDDDSVPAIVEGTIDADDNGNLVFTRLVFVPRPDGPALDDRRALRAVSMPSIVAEAIRKTAMPWDPETGLIHVDQDTELPEVDADDIARLRRTREFPPGVHTPLAHLRKVAKVYRAGDTRGTKAVMDEWGTSRATASRWVRQARERNLLGPALKQRAGEAKKPSRRK